MLYKPCMVIRFTDRALFGKNEINANRNTSMLFAITAGFPFLSAHKIQLQNFTVVNVLSLSHDEHHGIGIDDISLSNRLYETTKNQIAPTRAVRDSCSIQP